MLKNVNETVAMILAGGRGSRLKALTASIAKPAVFFGGKYRIIDFALSNVSNSGIDKVGVLTQYESTDLSIYIGSGANWGLNGNRSMVAVLPPMETGRGASWYKGTADAIYQNIRWLDSQHPKNVLILSGDHIYRQDYRDMIEAHVKNDADLTIAVIRVDPSEASRFGIMSVDDAGRITQFEEKPAHPKSNLASMGIYVFKYEYLRKALIADAENPKSHRDFGKDIIPTMLAEKRRLYSYVFKGYWRDVGTIQSLWQANMDLLDPRYGMEILGDKPRLYSAHTHSIPSFVGPKGKIHETLANQGSTVLGTVDHSILFNETFIGENAKVSHAVLFPGAKVKPGVVVSYALIGQSAVVDHDVVGTPDNIEVVTEEEA